MFFIVVAHVLSLLWQFSFHWLTMGKVKFGIYCYLIADILTKLFQKYLLSCPLTNRSFLSKQLKFIGCYCNQKAKSLKKYLNQLLRSYMGDVFETFAEMFIAWTATKLLFFCLLFCYCISTLVAMAIWSFHRLKMEKMKICSNCSLIACIWKNFFRNVCRVVLHHTPFLEIVCKFLHLICCHDSWKAKMLN